MTIAENLNRLYDVKENIKTAIETKGVTVGDTPFTEYPQKVSEIIGGDCEGVYQKGYDDGYNYAYDGAFSAGYSEGYGRLKAKTIAIDVAENGVYTAEDDIFFNKVNVKVDNVMPVITLTSKEYDDLTEKDNNVIYLIKG